MKVTLLAFDDCMASAVFGLVDAFNIASACAGARAPAPFAPAIATPGGVTVRGFGGLPIVPAQAIEQSRDSDIVVVPPVVGDIVSVLERERALVGWLRAQAGSTRILSSVCTGAFFLAEAGLLRARRATTNPLYGALFRARYPEVPLELDRRVLDQNSVVCAGSTTAFLDLAIYLVERVAGHELAVLTAKALSTDKNAESQRPYFLFVAAKDHGDANIVAAQDWIEQHYREPLAVEDLAGRLALSVRSLNRRFGDKVGMAPSDYLRRVRIEAAKRLLEAGELAVETITHEVGYEDIRSFCRLFRVATGLTPRAYRERFTARYFPVET